MYIVNLFIMIVLILLTAFFVAAEFAVVKVRSTRIDQLIEEGNKAAISTKRVISDLDEYLSACQLGITLAALGIGWLGEPTVGDIIERILHYWTIPTAIIKILSVIVSFVIITFFNVVVGELAPKTFAIQKTEMIALFVSRPLIWFNRIMFPFIWSLNKSSRFITRMLGLEPAPKEIALSEEELRLILTESYRSGEINQSEFKYVNNIFEFDERIAKEIMVPRPEIISLSVNATIEEVLNMSNVEKHTRYPVIEEDKDNIIGVINIKEVMAAWINQHFDLTNVTLRKFVKPTFRVIVNVPIHDLLVKLQKDRMHMAILIDEYGGTAGLVTIEDILEEIVGEIRDEFDTDEVSEIRKVNENHYLLDGKVLIEDVNDLLGTHIIEEEVDTIGGWILTQKFDVNQGDKLEESGYIFTVKEIEDKHILYVEVQKINGRV